MILDMMQRYYESVQQLLAEIAVSQRSALERAAGLVADTVKRNGLIYTLGSGHSLLIAGELYFRAGGLANFDVIHDKTFGRAERISGYAKVLLDGYPINANDLLILVSNSGRNTLSIEMALEARDRNIKTIAITSLRHSRAVSPRNSIGLRLFEVCDLVIDNCGVPGDTVVEVPGEKSIQVGPTSTLCGIFIANCIVTLAVQRLLEAGIRPPVFVSANLDHGDESNRHLLQFMRERIRGL